MSTVKDILNKLDQFAPFKLAEDFDNVGLIVGDPTSQVRKALVCLDITNEVVEEAIKMGANLIVSHHPPIFHTTKTVTKDNLQIPFKLLSNEISAIACHTNLDIADGGVNDVLFDLIGLRNKKTFAMPKPGEKYGLGRVGQLEEFMTPVAFADHVKRKIGAKSVRYVVGKRSIKTIAICGGSGGSLLPLALRLNVDALVTGDIKHDVFIDAQNEGITLIDAGHYATEYPGMVVLKERLSRSIQDLAFTMAETGIEKVKYI